MQQGGVRTYGSYLTITSDLASGHWFLVMMAGLCNSQSRL